MVNHWSDATIYNHLKRFDNTGDIFTATLAIWNDASEWPHSDVASTHPVFIGGPLSDEGIHMEDISMFRVAWAKSQTWISFFF